MPAESSGIHGILHDRIGSQRACQDSRPSLSSCVRRCGSAVQACAQTRPRQSHRIRPSNSRSHRAAKTAVQFKAWVMKRRQRLAGALGDHVGQTAAPRCRVPTMGHRALQRGAALNHEIGLGAGLQPRVRGSRTPCLSFSQSWRKVPRCAKNPSQRDLD